MKYNNVSKCTTSSMLPQNIKILLIHGLKLSFVLPASNSNNLKKLLMEQLSSSYVTCSKYQVFQNE